MVILAELEFSASKHHSCPALIRLPVLIIRFSFKRLHSCLGIIILRRLKNPGHSLQDRLNCILKPLDNLHLFAFSIRTEITGYLCQNSNTHAILAERFPLLINLIRSSTVQQQFSQLTPFFQVREYQLFR